LDANPISFSEAARKSEVTADFNRNWLKGVALRVETLQAKCADVSSCFLAHFDLARLAGDVWPSDLRQLLVAVISDKGANAVISDKADNKESNKADEEDYHYGHNYDRHYFHVIC
jgi:hypothetical protein